MSDQTRNANGERHVFVVVEAGAFAKALDWTTVRQSVIDAGGYLSLALADGARSKWVVRPAPSATEIPTLASTSAAKVAGSGIAASVIDQVLEAQALVPTIQFTEIRLYGGALAETELNKALKGEPTIQLRVFDNGMLRSPRSTYKPPAALRSAAAKHGPMQPNPNSAPGRMVGSKIPTPKPTPTRVTAQASASPRNLGSVAPAAVWRAGRNSFIKRHGLVRRVIAGLIAASIVGIGVFPGYVWTIIWSYSYPADAPLIAEMVAFEQSQAFGASLLFGLLVALVGARARWLALLGLAYGIVAGILPAAIPDFLAWPAPSPLAATLSNVAAFWGMWTAWAPVLYIAAGIVLCVAVSNILRASRP